MEIEPIATPEPEGAPPGIIATIDSGDHKAIQGSPALQRFVDRAYRLKDLLDLCRLGLRRVSGSVEAAKALGAFRIHRGVITQNDVDQLVAEATAQATQADAERDIDFGTLNGFAMTILWGLIESSIHDTAYFWIDQFPEVLARPSFAGVKLDLGTFIGLSDEERRLELLRQYRALRGIDRKAGIDGLCQVIEDLGLRVIVDEPATTILFELSEIRNVLVHRGGLVDRRLVRNCPWLNAHEGAQVAISTRRYMNSFLAANLFNTICSEACVSLTRLRGHHPKGGYDVPHGQDRRAPCAA